jgi:hypothetical protein
MAEPTIPQILSDLLQSRRISEQEFDQFITNYRYFEVRATEIRERNAGQWVASLGGELYVYPYFRSLASELQSRQGWRFAYVEQIKV